MASIAFSAVGNTLFPAKGLAHGAARALFATVGAVADQRLIIPALSGGEEKGIPSFGSFDVPYGEEGTPQQFAYGTRTKVTGAVIAASEAYPEVISTGGGKRQEPAQITWYRNAVYALTANPQRNLRRIDFDADPVFVNTGENTIRDDWRLAFREYNHLFNTIQVWTFRPAAPAQGTIDGYWLTTWYWIIETIPPLEGEAQEKLTQFIQGVDATVQLSQASTVQLPDNLGVPLLQPQPPTVGPEIRPNPASFPVVASFTHRVTSGGTAVNRVVLDLKSFIDAWNASGATPSPFREQPSSSPVQPQFYPLVDPATGTFPPPVGNDVALVVQQDFGEEGFWEPGAVESDPTLAATTRFYPGGLPGQPQLPQVDPVYEQTVGTGLAPGLPGTAFVALQKMNLSRKSHTPLPTGYLDSINTAQANPVQELRLSTMIDILLTQHTRPMLRGTDFEIQAANWFAQSEDEECPGVQWGGLRPANEVLTGLMLAFDVYLVETQGRLEFLTRQARQSPDAAIEHLNARPLLQAPSRRLTEKELHRDRIPRQINLRFRNVQNNLNWGTQRDSLDGIVAAGRQVRQVEVPVSIPRDQAQRIADRLLDDAQMLRIEAECTLPFWYANLTPTDVLELRGTAPTVAGRTRPDGETFEDPETFVLIDTIDTGRDMTVKIRGWKTGENPVQSQTADPGAVFESRQQTQETSLDGGGGVRHPVRLQPVILDIPPLLDTDMTTSGVYVTSAAPSVHGPRGGILVTETGNGVNWQDTGVRPPETGVGTCDRPLPDAAFGVIDEASELVVTMLSTAATVPQSTTDDAFTDNRANLCAVQTDGGWELLQYRDVERLDVDRFKMTHLRRGLYGTEDQMKQHTVRAGLFVILDSMNAIEQLPLDASKLGIDHRFRIQAAGVSAFGQPEAQLTPQGFTAKPLPVTQLRAERRPSGNVEFTWVRRTRAQHRTFGTATAPLVEGTESYELVVNPNSTNWTVERGTPDYVYTNALQLDHGVAGEELDVDVYMVDPVTGRSIAKRIVIPIPQTNVEFNGVTVEFAGVTWKTTAGPFSSEK